MRTARVVAAAALVLLPAQALAYQFLQRNGFPMRWSSASMGGDGDIDYYQEVTEAPSGIPAVVDEAFATWESLPSTTLDFTKQGQQTSGLNRGFFFKDGVNVVSYGDAGDDLETGVLAAAVQWDENTTHSGPGGTFTTIVESDIVFNDGVDFTDSQGASLSSGCIPGVTYRFDAEAVALHEIGHMIGLDHAGSYSTAIMYASIADCDPNRTNPKPDDVNGASALYPSGNAAVYPEFSVTDAVGYAPHTPTFHNSSSGPITSYQWDLGDGTTSTDEEPVHEYEDPGSYTVRLTVNGSVSSEMHDAVRVVERPEPDFSADVVSGDPPLTVAFTNLTPNPQGLEWDWSFGDGQHSTIRQPTHTYTKEGWYTVTLQADAGPGWIAHTKSKYIKVGNPGDELIPGCECRVTAGRRPGLLPALLSALALAFVLRRRS